MTPSPRPLLPTDVLALAAYGARSLDNRAWPRERVGADSSAHPLSLMLDKVRHLGRERTVWVTIDMQRLHGLIAARPRGSHAAWEIDMLIDAGAESDTLPALIDAALQGVGENRGEKLFVRLSAGDTALIETFRDAGFASYRDETLYIRATPPSVSGATELNSALPSDDYPTFRLYTSITPEVQRRVEAATFSEWHAAQERRWLKQGGVELVQHRDGQVSAWAGAAGLPWGTLVSLALDASAAGEAASIVTAAALRAGRASPLNVLVSHSDESVARHLEEAGFTARREFVDLVRRTTVLKALPARVTAVATNAVQV